MKPCTIARHTCYIIGVVYCCKSHSHMRMQLQLSTRVDCIYTHNINSYLHTDCIFFYCFIKGEEKRVYEFIARHFLACCSQDAKGFETTVEIDIAGEKVGLQAIYLH